MIIRCYRCKTSGPRPEDASQDDICSRCLRELRIAEGVLPPDPPTEIAPEFLAFRAHVELGAVPTHPTSLEAQDAACSAAGGEPWAVWHRDAVRARLRRPGCELDVVAIAEGRG